MKIYNRIQSGFGQPESGGWMDWEAGLIDRMEKMAIISTVMRDYYSTKKPSLGKFAQSHPQHEVDVVSSILVILSED